MKTVAWPPTFPGSLGELGKKTVRGKEFREGEKFTGVNPRFGQEQNIQLQGEEKII